MLGVRLARAGGLAVAGITLACLAVIAAQAHAALPSVSSGERPGPPILYAPAPAAPQLSLSAPFAAPPLLVSGTDAYRDGEYVYQDYLFDDRGADTFPGEGSRPDNLSSGNFSPTAGDVQYPTADRYAGNAADLVELRIKPTATHLIYRVTLNSVVEPDTTVVGIGIDTDSSGGAEVEWPNGAGVSSPGLDRFITVWGTGGELTTFPGGTDTALPGDSVSIDTTTKQMTISVPRAMLNPSNTDVWRHVAGTGLWNSAGHAWRTPAAGTSPGADQPASGGPQSTSGVFNLAFRFDEPQTGQVDEPPPPYSTFPGTGNWFEDKQSVALADGTTAASTAGTPDAGGDDFHADVDFAELAGGTNEANDEDIHAPGPTQARIFASRLGLPQGVQSDFPEYGGQLQPYLLRVPVGTDPSSPTPLTFALHSLGGNYNQFSVFSPNQLDQLGDERDNLVATPLARGPDGWYTGHGESDVFEVWADINRHFNLDPDRSYVSGYSMGGYGSYKLGVEYPDLWARAFTVVGPPGEGIWIPGAPGGGGVSPETLTRDLLENVRWVPYLNWAGSTDELVPVVGPIAQQQRFDALGLRSSLVIFAPADHFALAVIDEWAQGRDFLSDATVTRDPSRVDYAFFPAATLGHLHNHAYWVSNLYARDTSAGNGARAEISARSLARGEGDPTTAPISNQGFGDKGPPLAYDESGTEWTGIPSVPAENALEVSLENLEYSAIEGVRAGLDGSRELRVELTTDGPSELSLRLPLPPSASVVKLVGGQEAPAPEVQLVDYSYALFDLPGPGTTTYLIRPTGATSPLPPGGQGEDSGTGGSGQAPTGSGGSSGRGGTPRCAGRAATIVGTAGDDRGSKAIRGTSGNDVIVALGGNDVVRGGGGDDVICGSPGNDTLGGGGADDSCYGGPGRDAIALSCELARSPRRL